MNITSRVLGDILHKFGHGVDTSGRSIIPSIFVYTHNYIICNAIALFNMLL